MDEKNAAYDFLHEDTGRNDIFAEKEENEPEETIVEEPEEEKPLPFHRDPKVQKYVEKQIEKALSSRTADTSHTEESASPSDVQDVIAAFTEIVGNDTPEKVRALQALEKTLKGSDERASQKAIERFKQEQEDAIRQQAEAEQKAQEELDNYFEEIEDTYGVDLSSNTASAKATRSQFIDYVRKIAPKDENGEVAAFPDLVSAFEEFQERNKRAPATRAKELASRGMARSGDTSTAPVAGKSWKDVDRYLSTLKG